MLETPGRGGRHRENLTHEEEETLLESFCWRAGQGGIVEAGPVRTAYEDRVGPPVSKSTLYRLLTRHGWRKFAPRPQHPETSAKQQEAFKKAALRGERGSTETGTDGPLALAHVPRRGALWTDQ